MSAEDTLSLIWHQIEEDDEGRYSLVVALIVGRPKKRKELDRRQSWLYEVPVYPPRLVHSFGFWQRLVQIQMAKRVTSMK